jgi:Holliday junction resolvase RusA-like endonuclease
MSKPESKAPAGTIIPGNKAKRNDVHGIEGAVIESVLIVLPLPHNSLHPNSHVASHGLRMRKARETARYRKLAKARALEQSVESAPWERVAVSATFFHRQRRKRDDVNFLGSLKAAYDGIVDSGLLVDDDHEHLTTLGANFEIDKEHPRVELRVERQA